MSIANLNDEELKEYYSLYKKGLSKTKRFELQKIQGQDSKYLYHLARLMDECEQILTLGTIDLQRSKEYLKAIRRGDVSEKELAKLYESSKLRYEPDWPALQTLLLNCLEEHYGSLKDAIVIPDKERRACQEIKAILEKYNL
jgi:hypothetical protein